MTRQEVIEIIREVLAFGKVQSSEVSDTTNTVGVSIVGANEDESTAPDEELLVHGPLQYRPQDADATGHMEGFFYRLGDDKVVIATKDRRFQISLEKGEAVITAMGASSPAYIKLKPDGTCVIVSTGVRKGAEGATQPDVLGTTLKSVLEALTVPTAMGPSGTPINAASFPTFLSAKHKIDS
jgi:hypothetical protein